MHHMGSVMPPFERTPVVYLVVETERGITVRFVVAKTRVAPLQAQTIPRLELLSAVLLSRLIAAVYSSLESTLPQLEPKCFTVALFWIRGTAKEWKPFVQNRVAEIRKNVPPDCWNHCSGKTNPADLPSRGLPSLELSVSQLWRRGPEWLNTTSSFPDVMEPTAMPEECAVEMRSKDQPTHALLASESMPTVGKILNCKDYDSLSHLLRVTARVLKAVRTFKSSVQLPATLTPEELAEAERLWLLHAQKQLTGEKSFPAWQNQFQFFIDDRTLAMRRATH